MKTLNITKDDWYIYIPTQSIYVDKTIEVTDIEHDFIVDAFEKMSSAQEIIKHHLENGE